MADKDSEDSQQLAFIASLQTLLRPVLGPRSLKEAWQPGHESAAGRFLAGQEPCLFAALDAAGGLQLNTSPPKQAASPVLFLLKGSAAGCSQAAQWAVGGAAATESTGAAAAPPLPLHGYLDAADVPGSLLRLMSELFAPALVAASGAWPDTLRHDFAGQLHRFMGTLTETVHARQGRTVLYVPPRELGPGGGGAAAHERDLVQRLESGLLRWTEQIGELLSRRTSDELMLDEGPLDELAFWAGRAADLGGVRSQLTDPGLLRVVKALEAAKSPYLPAFLSLGEDIQREAAKAESNVQFLSALEAPCTKLVAAGLAEVPALLPGILDLLRMVWTLSPHYNTPDRIASLLRKVSNEVLARCRSHVDLAALFSGCAQEAAERALQLSIDTTARWKEAYAAAAARVSAAMPDRPWAAGSAGSFAHVDAFVQRCRDLQEMCAAQRQFASDPQLSAVLAGPKAAEISKAVAEVQASFGRLMLRFQHLPYDALDVKNSQWYEDVTTFRSTARDLELMLGNIIGGAFDVAATLCLKLEVLEAFYRTATREGLRKCIEAKMTEWHLLFIAEINQVKDLFDQVKGELPVAVPLPESSGQALVMKGLLRRIERTWDSLQNVASFLPGVAKVAESAAAYEALHAGLQQAINTINTVWYRSAAADPASLLSASLLSQDRRGPGVLGVNMDVQLACLVEEAYLFERLRLGVPGVAGELLAHRHRLLAERGCMEQVVRQYNRLLLVLSKDERRLFKDRIRHLDRRVLPGVNKLNWSSQRHQVDFFYWEAGKFCRETAAAVLELKAAGVAVARACAALRGTPLVSIERKRLYDLADFDTRQAQHQETARARLAEAHARVVAALVPLNRYISRDGEEVQQEWLKFLQRVDEQVLEALTAAARRSLHEVARALNGDRKGSEVPPVFVLSVVLDSNRVELKPTLQQLFDTTSGVCKRAVALLEGIPRITQEVLAACSATYGTLPALLAEAPAAAPYVELVNRNEEAVLKMMQAVTAGITGVVEKVQQFLVYFEKKYRQIYEQDKDAHMKRYERANKPAAVFEADVQRFRDLSEEVLSEESLTSMRFLRLDCGPLKQTLTGHCEAWIGKFAALLHSLAERQLASTYDALREHTAALAVAQEGQQERLDKAQAARAELQQRMAQCREKYAALGRLQVSLADEEAERLERLPRAWAEFEEALEAAAAG